MNSHDRMNVLQRTLAVLGATGAAALMVLPAFAQTAPITDRVVNHGDAVRNSSGMSNQTPNGQVLNTMTSDQCSYVNGGVGGPIESQSYDSQSRPVLSSDTVAARGVQGAAPSNVNQFPNSNMIGQPIDQTMIGSTTYNSRMQSSSMNQSRRQFDGNNPSAAIAYRQNGPAGTAGHEAKMNLDAYQMRQSSYPDAYSLSSPQSAMPLPVACIPR